VHPGGPGTPVARPAAMHQASVGAESAAVMRRTGRATRGPSTTVREATSSGERPVRVIHPGELRGGRGVVPAARSEWRTQRTYVARSCCGAALTYEAPTFVPVVGEVVPCRRHGFCAVECRETCDGRGADADARSGQCRSQAELLAFLTGRPVTTVHVLHSRRFTLRVVAAAQKAGHVDIDLVTGQVRLSARGSGVRPRTSALHQSASDRGSRDALRTG
jgi:hypothetical protein